MLTSALQRVALLSVHTSPLATLGGKKTGGMNVYIRDFGRKLACRYRRGRVCGAMIPICPLDFCPATSPVSG
ncbi:MAG: hypothetical protein R2856_03235 [Caldilineaceae bacterium]